MGTPLDARIALLGGLIDHAPLFPPASLSLPEALAEDRRAAESPFAFALGRFVCPASLLPDFPPGGRPLSIVLDDAFEGDERVEAVETTYRDDLASLAQLAPEVYVEIPIDDRLETRLEAVAQLGFRAKVRCGGTTTPRPQELARFVGACRERELAFKATAGLHHAVSASGEHGFLNLLAAAVFGKEQEILLEEEPDAFRLDGQGFGWRGRIAGAEQILEARRGRLHSIGSCSFFEPMEELDALGLVSGLVSAS